MIFKEQDPLGRDVKLKRNTWEMKILNLYDTNCNGENGNNHPEMEEFLSEVKQSIAAPQFIIRDTEVILGEDGEENCCVSSNREEFVKFYFSSSDNKMKSIKTIVEFDGDYGEIVTTHKMRPNGIKNEGGIIYDSTRKTED